MPAKKTARPWIRLDRDYLLQPSIRQLAERHGASGPLAFLAIVLEGNKATGNASGGVEMSFSTLAYLASVDLATAAQVVASAAELGLLDNLECDGERFSGRRTKAHMWDSKDPADAERKARLRAEQD
jgi:hypothetical protein